MGQIVLVKKGDFTPLPGARETRPISGNAEIVNLEWAFLISRSKMPKIHVKINEIELFFNSISNQIFQGRNITYIIYIPYHGSNSVVKKGGFGPSKKRTKSGASNWGGFKTADLGWAFLIFWSKMPKYVDLEAWRPRATRLWKHIPPALFAHPKTVILTILEQTGIHFEKLVRFCSKSPFCALHGLRGPQKPTFFRSFSCSSFATTFENDVENGVCFWCVHD